MKLKFSKCWVLCWRGYFDAEIEFVLISRSHCILDAYLWFLKRNLSSLLLRLMKTIRDFWFECRTNSVASILFFRVSHTCWKLRIRSSLDSLCCHLLPSLLLLLFLNSCWAFASCPCSYWTFYIRVLFRRFARWSN